MESVPSARQRSSRPDREGCAGPGLRPWHRRGTGHLQIGFKVAGILVDLRADVGDRVAKGAVLARLDDREQRAQVASANAAIEQATANLQKAMASVEKAQANYDNAKNINERRQALLKGNNTSVEAAQTAQAAEDAALADVNLANSEVAVAKATISDAKAQQQLQTATLDFHTLVAPYDAMVTARLKELGSALNAGEPVFTLIDPKTIWVLAYIDESKAGEIKVGEPAAIVLRSHPNQRLQGRVARIEPESDRVNEERRIEVAFDQSRPMPISASRRRSTSRQSGCRRLCWFRKQQSSGSERTKERCGPSKTGICSSAR